MDQGGRGRERDGRGSAEPRPEGPSARATQADAQTERVARRTKEAVVASATGEAVPSQGPEGPSGRATQADAQTGRVAQMDQGGRGSGATGERTNPC